MLKYVELHDDAEPSFNPWTIRQAIVYQKFDIEGLKSNLIFVRLSTAMQDALQDFFQENQSLDQTSEFVSQWGNIHILCLRTLNDNWRQYINYLDAEVSDIVSHSSRGSCTHH